MNSIILAPHPDDEIIGCYSVMKRHKTQGGNLSVVMLRVGSVLREKESRIFAQNFPFHICYRTLEGMRKLMKGMKNPNGVVEQTIIYAPDPIFETHPDHRAVGMIAEELLREENKNVIFYSVNMRAPYVFPIQRSYDKEFLLSQAYPTQRKLWENDSRYFLFEGYTKWMNPIHV